MIPTENKNTIHFKQRLQPNCLPHDLEIITANEWERTSQYHTRIFVAKFTGKRQNTKSGYIITTPRIYVCVCMYVYMYIFVYVYMYVLYIYIYIFIYLFIFYICVYVCVFMCIYVYLHVLYMHISIYVCIYVVLTMFTDYSSCFPQH